MRLGSEGFFHLTYCTNIHPGNGWHEVYANLQNHAPALKARVAPDRPLGIGLRLSGLESAELLQGDHLQQFSAFLRDHGLYVFTLNGFPYGAFHKQPVKANVHAPDWRDEERVQYTLRLIAILARLLPEDVDGGISTSPLSYKEWVNPDDTATWEQFTRNMVRVCEALIVVRRERGIVLHLDIEPEPDGLLENCQDVARFYRDWLFAAGARMLAQSLGVPHDVARGHLLDHIRVSFDTCHSAVAYEDPAQALDELAAIGIQVGKIQIGSALKVPFPRDAGGRTALEQELRPFADPIYLHQVVQRNHDGTLQQYPDLENALPGIHDPQITEWRIHFHVPIFVERYAAFLSTQDHIRRVLALLHRRRFTRHLEIETYTWDVLPPDLKSDLLDSISREFRWVLNVFQ